MKKINVQILAFLFLISIQIFILYLCNGNKDDLFIDEYYTFNFANSDYLPLLSGIFNRYNEWLDSSYWHQIINVQPGKAFNYSAVYYNTANDVHPPLYYLFVHTICSFWRSTNVTNLGLVINVVFFVATQILIYLICIRLIDSKVMSYVCCAFYGFSVGAISIVLLIRMYMMLTFICILYLFVWLKYLEFFKKRWLFSLFLLNIIGFLTHYYFILYASGLFFAYSYGLISEKKSRFCFYVFWINIASLIISIWLFPECLEHIFGNGATSYRGIKAISNYYIDKLFNIGVFYCYILYDNFYLFCLFILSIFSIILGKNNENNINNVIDKRNNINRRLRHIIFVLLILCNVVMVVSPFTSGRYLCYLYPLFSIFTVYYAYVLSFQFRRSTVVTILLLTVLTEIIFDIKIFKDIPSYRGNEYLNIIKYDWIVKNDIRQLILVTDKKKVDNIVFNFGILSNVQNTYITNDIDLYGNKLDLNNNIIVFVDKNIDEEKVVDYLKNNYGFSNFKKLKSRVMMFRGTHILVKR